MSASRHIQAQRAICARSLGTGRPETFSVAFVLAAALAACSGAISPARRCNVDVDCASGHCGADGTCSSADSGVSLDARPFDPRADAGRAADAGRLDGTSRPDADLDAGGPAVDSGPTMACRPNHDGVISAAEAPLGAGHEAMFRVTRDVDPFRSEAECSAGRCVWDWVDLSGTTTEEETRTEAIDGRWYADEPAFAQATYASRMGELRLSIVIDICRQVQYGVYQVTDDALLMLGIVSEREEDGTLLVYDPPLKVLSFPFSAGSAWSTETTASGPLCNSLFPFHIRQTYTSTVDATGQMRTPYGDFEDVLRVNTLIERHAGIGVAPTSMRSHAFVTECFTTVAMAASEEGEDAPEMDRAAEVRRLSNFP